MYLSNLMRAPYILNSDTIPDDWTPPTIYEGRRVEVNTGVVYQATFDEDTSKWVFEPMNVSRADPPEIKVSSLETYQGVPVTFYIENYDSDATYYVILPDSAEKELESDTYKYTPDFDTEGSVTLKFYTKKVGFSNSKKVEKTIEVNPVVQDDSIIDTDFQANNEKSKLIEF